MKKYKLISISDIRVGYQSRKRIESNVGGSHKLLQGKDFETLYSLRFDDIVRFFPENVSNIYEIKKEDILFQSKGLKHYAYHVDKDIDNAVAAGSFFILRIKGDNIIPEYVAWWINQKPVQSFFQSHASGTHMPFISKKTLSELTVNVPSLSVQQKIIRIEKLWRNEQKLNDRLSGLRSHLITSICLQSIDNQGVK